VTSLLIYFIGRNDYVIEQIREELTVIEIFWSLSHDPTHPGISLPL
jgi:hypothetical protein